LLAALYRQQLQARIQSLRRGAAAAPEATALSPEQRDNLKALGYIQ
jgi:predicted kinase